MRGCCRSSRTAARTAPARLDRRQRNWGVARLVARGDFGAAGAAPGCLFVEPCPASDKPSCGPGVDRTLAPRTVLVTPRPQKTKKAPVADPAYTRLQLDERRRQLLDAGA